MTHKFKLDDIITLKDNPLDLAVKRGEKGFYKIIEITPTSYGIYSLLKDYTYTAQEMDQKIKEHQIDYNHMVKKLGKEVVDEKYPVHSGRCKNAKEFFEDGYKLATVEDVEARRQKLSRKEP